jgi:hypothetical protein
VRMLAAAVASNGSSTNARLSFLRPNEGLWGRNEVDVGDMGLDVTDCARDGLFDKDCGGER